MFKQWITNLIPNFNTDLISAPVVFTLAQWIGTNECSVPVFHGFGSLLDFLLKSPNYLTPNQVNDVGELIKNCSINQGVKPLSKPVVKPILKPKKLD
jgi:hypothetical protein